MNQTKEPYGSEAEQVPGDRETLTARIEAAHEQLMSLLTSTHTEDFLDIDVTMSQAKVLYLVVAAGEMRMAALPGLLRISLSTVSGTVDRLVEHGLLDRRADPADRRQVVLRPTDAGIDAFERFRELNARALRDLLDLIDLAGLADVAHAYVILVQAAISLAGRADTPCGGPDLPDRKGNL